MGYIGKLHCLRLRSIFHSPSSCSFLVMLCLVFQSCPTLCDPMECSPPGSSVCGDTPGKNTGVGSLSLLQGNLPNPEIKLVSPALQEDSLPAELPRKPFSLSSQIICLTVSCLGLSNVLLICKSKDSS